ncbi:tripartite motif-containing protein 2-like [Lingula anatina]|uniref:Tripartite motif-containing protein 2-like n=1 Tax=Lingula anatina TaxID=7574 RepID=A0A1S3IWM5_LINAN|nr:tripartite motif-containing protein 2-like [Lingula anatina]|eukprot:XP_013402371.1 tripartite motif-containing protein 2-like [Lingula anatina]
MATARDDRDEEESLRAKITEYFVSCPLCLEEYKDPTDLPCRHTFCKGCLKDYIPDITPGSKFRCPVCQKETEVTKDGLEGFTHNLFIESLQDTVLQSTHKKKCTFCSLVSQTETVATSKCITCHDYLCERCSPFHCGSTLTKDHRVLTFQQLHSSEYQKEIKEQQKIICPEHKGEMIRYFCSDCNVPICRDCKDLHHDGHKLISLEKAAEMVKPQLRNKCHYLERKLATGEKTLLNIDNTLATFLENESSVQQQIKAHAAKIRQLLDQQEQTLLQELHKTSSTHRKNLQTSYDNCSATCSSIKTTTDVVKNILQHGAPIDVLMLQHQLGQRLDELQSTSAVEEIPEEIHLTLTTNKKVDQEISSGAGLGNVQISRQPALPKFKPQAVCMLEFNTGSGNLVDISVSPNREYVTTHASYVTAQNKVKVLRSDGTLRKKITRVSDTQLKCPVGICHFPDGRMVLSDADNNKLFIQSPHWEVQQTVDVSSPQGVALNNSCTKIAVAQFTEKSVSVFSIDIKGKITLTDVIKDKDGEQLFNSPYKVAYMSNGCLAVSDERPNKLHILTPSGDPLYQYTGPDNKLGDIDGVCVDAYDNILVTDYDNHCIHLVSPDGKFIHYIATKADGLENPWGCTINQDGDLVVTQGNGKVKVFQYL